MIDFNFLTAKELSTALEFLNNLENTKIIAGGTDLIVDIRKQSSRLPKIDYVLDISSIQELKFIRQSDGYVEIGPLVTHNMLINDPVVKENFPILVEAAKGIGSNQIRNRGTIGGNICNAATCADTIPPLLALNAEVVLSSKDKNRTLAIEKFITGPYKTSLAKNEIMSCIRIPRLVGKYHSYYYKVGRRKALNISRLTVILLAKIEDGVFIDVRFVPGAVTPQPIIFHETQNAICGKSVDTIDAGEIGSIACRELLSITGNRWSTEYKKPVIAALVKRALEEMIREVKA